MLIHVNFKLTSAWTCYLFWVSFLASKYNLTFLIFSFSCLFALARFQHLCSSILRYHFFLLSIRGMQRRKGNEKKSRGKKEKETWAKEQVSLFFEQAAASDNSPKVVFFFTVGLECILKTFWYWSSFFQSSWPSSFAVPAQLVCFHTAWLAPQHLHSTFQQGYP